MMKKSTIAIIALLAIALFSCAKKENPVDAAWFKADEIVKSIVKPEFPDKSFNVLDFGARVDSTFNSNLAFNEAIAKCNADGGGTVVVPGGVYFSAGPIKLLSNVRFHLEDGAVINFSTVPSDYLPVVLSRWEGVELYNYSALIYANGEKNIALTGKGVLIGNASSDNWWPWKGKEEYGFQEGMPSQLDPQGRPKLLNMNNTDAPLETRIFGEGSYLRPNFLQTIDCKNILIEDVKFVDSPMWFINPVLCENITVKGVTVVGKGPNNDGLDPESCKNVLIEDCFFDTGDDCIAIKSGRNNDGRRINIPSENIVIRNCTMHDGHGGIVMGSEISGGCKNVFAENCLMDSPNLDRALRIKTNFFRGGAVENIYLRNITVGEVKEAIVKINLNYDIKNESGDKFLPSVKNVYLTDIKSSKSKHAFFLEGLENSNIKNVGIFNSELNGVEQESILHHVINFETENVKVNGKQFNN